MPRTTRSRVAERGYENQFDTTDSGATDYEPVQCSSLKKKSYIIIDKGSETHPCKLVEYTVSKPGKHGAAKMHIIGLDIFTGKKYDMISGTTSTVETPLIIKEDLIVSNISEDWINVIQENGQLHEIRMAPIIKDKFTDLRNKYEELENEPDTNQDIYVQVARWRDSEYVIGWKVISEK